MPLLSRRALRLCATSAILLFAALAAGCAPPVGYPALEQADAAVERARRSPRVRALAAAELDRAEVALQDARAAARAGASPDRVDHLVYVVNQRAALAEARAAQRVARSEIAMLEGTLDHTLAQGRVQSGRQRRASFPARDRQPRAPLRDAPTPWAEDQQAPSRLPVSRQIEAPLREIQQAQPPPQAHAPLQEFATGAGAASGASAVCGAPAEASADAVASAGADAIAGVLIRTRRVGRMGRHCSNPSRRSLNRTSRRPRRRRSLGHHCRSFNRRSRPGRLTRY